jgi:hypothetical protein
MIGRTDAMVVYNNGKPAPPGWQVRDHEKICCFCCRLPCRGVAVAGTCIPEGAELLPWAEARPILTRWRGHWHIQPFEGQAPFEFTDVYIDGDFMAFSGGEQISLNIGFGEGGWAQTYRRPALRIHGQRT